MAGVTLVYLHVIGKSDPKAMDPTWYIPCSYRFTKTLLEHRAGMPYKLCVVSCGGPVTDDTVARFNGVATEHISYTGPGWDIGAHQFAASGLDADLALFCATPCHFKKEGWLLPIVKAFEELGEGLYGVAGSKENHPHIRTGAFACPPKLFRQYPILIDSREKCYGFECGCDSKGQILSGSPKSFTDWVINQKKPAVVVDWNCVHPKETWRSGDNIFRRGNQSDMLIHDRHTDMYDTCPPIYRKVLEQLSDIGHYP